MMRYTVMLLAGLLAMGMAGTAKANLVVNGNFDNPYVGSSDGFFASVTGWTVNRDSFKIDNDLYFGVPCITAGCQSEELNANVPDAISQVITGLTVGDSYTLSWEYGVRAFSGNQHATVSFGGSLVTTDYGLNQDYGGWTLNTFTVVATSTSETLTFAGQADTGYASQGNDITAVSLVGAATPNVPVPEPASLGLVAVGLLGLTRRLRRA